MPFKVKLRIYLNPKGFSWLLILDTLAADIVKTALSVGL
jgi:hypothetical protein